MGKRRAGTKRKTDLRPECIPLGFLAERSAHGYELFQQFQATLADLWHISESQMYATVKRLEARGLVSIAPPRKGSAAASKVLTLTDEGRAEFEEWLRTPTLCVPRLLRLEFITRVFFARRRDAALLSQLVADQRTALAREVARLEREGGTDDDDRNATDELDTATMTHTFRLNQVHAACDWLEQYV